MHGAILTRLVISQIYDRFFFLEKLNLASTQKCQTCRGPTVTRNCSWNNQKHVNWCQLAIFMVLNVPGKPKLIIDKDLVTWQCPSYICVNLRGHNFFPINKNSIMDPYKHFLFYKSRILCTLKNPSLEWSLRYETRTRICDSQTIQLWRVY